MRSARSRGAGALMDRARPHPRLPIHAADADDLRDAESRQMLRRKSRRRAGHEDACSTPSLADLLPTPAVRSPAEDFC